MSRWYQPAGIRGMEIFYLLQNHERKMRNLKTIRIFLATMFFVATVAYLVIGPQVHPMAGASRWLQIVPSALAATIGITVFWFLISFLFGRIYCSTVCPIGSLQDCAIWLRGKVGKRPPFRFTPGKRWRYDLLIAYLICVMLGVMGVCYFIEPWNMMRNIASIFNTDAVANTWGTLAFGVTTGVVAGVVSLAGLLVWAYFKGRQFCTDVCPLGSAMGVIAPRTLFHIDIQPDKCTGCLKCEDVCAARCIKVVGRYVDNSRCIRCFDCLNVCPEDAIRFQSNPNRRFGTPLLRRRRKA